MSHKIKLSYSKWADIGFKSKQIEKLVSDLRCDTDNFKRFSKSEQKYLTQIYEIILKFKNEAEEEMFVDIHNDYKNDRDLFHVFYGPYMNEPLKEPEKLTKGCEK